MLNLKRYLGERSVHRLLSYAVGPSSEGLKTVCEKYRDQEDWFVYGYKEEEHIVGCIGIQTTGTGKAEILHISVSPQYRTLGIGSKMVAEMMEQFSLALIFAETDKDAVGFYQKLGFTVISLGEKYPGVERFLCEFNFK